MIRNLIVGVFLALFSFGVAAQSNVNTTGLSEEQVLQLQLEAAKLRDSTSTKVTAEKISEYTLVGQQVSQAIITVASELGKSVDDVLTTTTGKIVVILVLWKVAGKDLFGIVAAFFWCLIFIPTWMYYFRKFCVNYRYEYHENGKLKTKQRQGAYENAVVIFIFAAIAIIIPPMFMAF